MRLWTPRGVPPARLTIPTNASRGTGQYLQSRPDDNLHMVFISSQLVASRVAPLLAEQKNADHAGAVLRFVLLA